MAGGSICGPLRAVQAGGRVRCGRSRVRVFCQGCAAVRPAQAAAQLLQRLVLRPD